MPHARVAGLGKVTGLLGSDGSTVSVGLSPLQLYVCVPFNTNAVLPYMSIATPVQLSTGGKLCMIADSVGSEGSATGVDLSAHRLYTCRAIVKKYNHKNIRLYLDDGTKFQT
ncbi:hypothetical protein SARC_15230, partial [Sphaeroforma arctica JP610]